MSQKRSKEQLLEDGLPYAAALVFSFVWFTYFKDISLPAKVEDLIKSSVNVSAVLIGFLATALALLFAIDDRSVIKFLRENFLYKRFIKTFFTAIIWNSIWLTSSSALIIHTYELESCLTKTLVNTWFFITCLSALSCFRVFWILFKTLHKQIEQDEG